MNDSLARLKPRPFKIVVIKLWRGEPGPVKNNYHDVEMSFPIKTCAVCGEEFGLKPDKPGFANRCPECSTSEAMESGDKGHVSVEERQAEKEVNEARRLAMRDLLYRKDR